jgi:hypothetical protein
MSSAGTVSPLRIITRVRSEMRLVSDRDGDISSNLPDNGPGQDLLP